MNILKSKLFDSSEYVQPIVRKSLSIDDMALEISKRRSTTRPNATLKPAHLVERNYAWMIVDGPGIVRHEYDYDTFHYPDPPKFDFLTVSLMGYNAIFADAKGRPSPFPQAAAFINCGEVPMTRKFWVDVAFLDPFLDPENCTVQLLPWSCLVQVGFEGWNFVQS